jgi:hypothetical protein
VSWIRATTRGSAAAPHGADRRAAASGGIAREAALAHLADTWRAAAPLLARVEAHVGRS